MVRIGQLLIFLGILFCLFSVAEVDTFACDDAAVTKVKIPADYRAIGSMAVLNRTSKIDV